MRLNILFSLILTLLSIGFANAQTVLPLDEALRIALENNFNIKIAQNDLIKAKNQVSKGNSGLLPRVDLSAGGRYGLSSGVIKRAGLTPIPDITYFMQPAGDVNAGINMSYNLFDGKAALTTYNTFKALSELSAKQSELTVENIMIQVINAYYLVAQLRENLTITQELVKISTDRIERARVKFEYAATNKLEILNAEVDLNADSVNLVNAQLNIAQAKRNLNLLLQRDVNTTFTIDTKINFLPKLDLNKLKTTAITNNRQLQLAQQNFELSLLDLQAAKAANHPTLSVGAGYNNTLSRNTPQDIRLNYNGTVSGNLSLNYNLFDGGRRKIQQQNAQVEIETSRLSYDQATENLYLNLENAYADYENSLYILKIELSNLEKAKLNFLRSREAFKIGQINSTQYRQAQFNLINAETRIVNARYTAKLNEMELVRLSGELL